MLLLCTVAHTIQHVPHHTFHQVVSPAQPLQLLPVLEAQGPLDQVPYFNLPTVDYPLRPDTLLLQRLPVALPAVDYLLRPDTLPTATLTCRLI
jgi:hypothetical protein